MASPPNLTVAQCLARSNKITLTGTRTTAYRDSSGSNDRTYDCRGLSISLLNAYNFIAGNGSAGTSNTYRAAIIGSSQDGKNTPTFISNNTQGSNLGWRTAYSPNTDNVFLRGEDWGIIAGVRTQDADDAISIRSNGHRRTFFRIEHCYLVNTYDDAVEDDSLEPGIMYDCLVDGTGVFLSQRLDASDPFSTPHTSSDVFTVDSCLVRLRQMTGWDPNPSLLANHILWKWDGSLSCKLVVKDSVFVVPGVSVYGSSAMRWPPDVEVQGTNYLLYGGGGDYPQPVPPGITVYTTTTSPSYATALSTIWQAKRTDWLIRHGMQSGTPSASVAALDVVPSSGVAPLAVVMDASASTSVSGTNPYTFDPGDGTGAYPAQSSATKAHTYQGAGTWTAKVTTQPGPSTATDTVAVSPAPVPPAAELRYSTSSDRSSPVALSGAILKATRYLFVGNDAGLVSARFFLDDPAKAGTPFSTDTSTPFDFAGGGATTPAVQGTATSATTGSGTASSLAVNVPASAAVGELLVAAVANRTGNQAPVVAPVTGASGAPAYSSLIGFFHDTGEEDQLLDGTVPANAYAYIVVHAHVGGATTGTTLAAIKAAHPSAKVLAYQNMGGMIAGPHPYSRPTSLVTQEEAAAHGTGADDWRLHRESDGGVAVFDDFAFMQFAHVGRATWRTQAASHFAQIATDGFGGVFLDDVNMSPQHGANEGEAGDTTEFASDVAYRDAVTAAMASLHTAAAAQGLSVVANVGMNPWDVDHYAGYTTLLTAGSIEGVCREFWTNWASETAYFTGATWSDTMKVQSDAEANGKFAMLNSYPLTTRDDVRSVRYGLASFYLHWDGAKASGFGYDDGRPLVAYGAYAKQVGVPAEAKQLVSGTSTDGAWQRRYTGGIVCCNAKSTAGLVTFALGGTYLDPSGTPVTSVQLDSAQGMVLLAGTPWVQAPSSPTYKGNSVALTLWAKPVVAGEPASYTWTTLFGGLPVATKLAGAMVRVSGVDLAAPWHAGAGFAETSGTAVAAHSTGSITTTLADCLLVEAFSDRATSTWTAPSGNGETERIDVATTGGADVSLELVTSALVGAGTYQKTATASNTSLYACGWLGALKPASGTPTGWDTTTVADGFHEVTAELTADGSLLDIGARFGVLNSAYRLDVSYTPDRKGAFALAGQTISGAVYVFLQPDPDIAHVDWWIDNPSMTGEPFHADFGTPWDLVGNDPALGNAYAWDTSQLAGPHSISVRITRADATTTTFQTNFTVGISKFVAATQTVVAATPASEITVAVPAGLQPGDVLLAAVANRSGIPIALPVGWSHATASPVDYGTSIHLAVCWHPIIDPALEPVSYRWDLGGDASLTAWDATVIAWRGINPTTPFHLAAQALETEDLASHVTGSITPTETGCWLVTVATERLVTATPTGLATTSTDIERVDVTTGAPSALSLAVYDSDSGTPAGSAVSRTITSGNTSRYFASWIGALRPAVATGIDWDLGWVELGGGAPPTPPPTYASLYSGTY